MVYCLDCIEVPHALVTVGRNGGSMNAVKDKPGIYEFGKLDMIKLVRCCSSYTNPNGTGLGLKEARDAVERYLATEVLPWDIRQSIDKLRGALNGPVDWDSRMTPKQVCKLLGIEKWQLE